MRAPTTAPRARTGCDLQRIDDVSDAIRDFGDRYLDRVYTPAEQEAGRLRGAASLAGFLAARFAAKEAVLKLIGTVDGVDPRDVEITHEDGRPVVRLSGRAATLAEEAGVGPIDVSLSHSGDHALAVAVAITELRDGPA
jgi:holo-[acyl-carrier protein] synthase